MSISAPWLLLMVPRAGLRCVIVVFPGQTHLRFDGSAKNVLFIFFEHGASRFSYGLAYFWLISWL